MSDTPKTDAIATAIIYFDVDHAKLANFARDLERENAALRSALDQQANYQRDLRADRDRLDWLESLAGPWPTYYDGWQSRVGKHDSLREAIDAAREKVES